MPWKKATPELIALFDENLASFAAQRKIMFGYPAYFANDNMFAGLHEQNVIMRLSDEDRAALTAAYPDTAPFEPMPGRPMREYVCVPPSLYRDARAFGDWLDRSYRFALSLPRKRRKGHAGP